MSRMTEDPATRRVVDTDSTAYRVGQQAANWLLEHEPLSVTSERLDTELMMQQLVEEDPEVKEHWGIYLVLRGMLDVFIDYEQDRADQ